MSPTNPHERALKPGMMINGLRPSPLKINKDSHLIQKPVPAPKQQQQQQRHGPVIIYTHSPKIIHTQARDFMALVQKLTGLSRSDNEVNDSAPSKPTEDNDSSSALTEDNGSSGGVDVNNKVAQTQSTNIITTPPVPFFGDVPLFTPNSADFFCSPRPVYKFADNSIMSPGLGNLNSPSLLEFMKGLPDY
ncbi:VQ motif-containing protein [Corchorus capsularis]|uniref:VQ motif-containing protein n=1 Tax=Corchorus capsularis TaxID=210143 RepID=A0A1R3J4I7_COCAP|nr:VQ motif-containing protein [Corchorus capsularis]